MAIAQANDLLTWLAILLPTLIPAAASFGTVYWIFKLSSKKETLELEDKKKRAASVSPSVWLQLNQLVVDAREIKGPTAFRELESKAKGICEYCEIATPEVFHLSSLNAFTRFAHLKRIALYFREEVIRLGLQTDSFAHDARDIPASAALAKVVLHVQERMEAYAQSYL